MESKIGRPKIPDSEKKVRESVYFPPDVREWLQQKAEKRESSISSVLTVIVRNEMKKEKERGK